MKEFMMIFRHQYAANYAPSPEELQAGMIEWQNWIGGIAAQVKFVSTHQLGMDAKVLKPDTSIADGPYTSSNEIVGGNIVVKAFSLEEAVEMAKGCPVLRMGGNVEVRSAISYNN